MASVFGVMNLQQPEVGPMCCGERRRHPTVVIVVQCHCVFHLFRASLVSILVQHIALTCGMFNMLFTESRLREELENIANGVHVGRGSFK